jgi:predicted nucleotidyltransferase
MTEEYFPLTRKEMVNSIKNHLNVLEDNYTFMGLDFCIIAIEFYGSRSKYSKKEPTQDSDIDVFIEVQGDVREDSLFNILNKPSNSLYIDGLKVDFNPVIKERTGTIEEHLKRIIKKEGLNIKPDQIDFYYRHYA